MKIAVLVSGGGTNLQAIIDACTSGMIKGTVELVISNRKAAYGLERARRAGIQAEYFGKGNYPEREERYTKLIELLKEKSIELVVLAGYLDILPPAIIDAYRDKIINVHPSLIPKYSGMGFYGEKVHQAVLTAGEKESGATVHFVDEGADTGKIIVQGKVSVDPDDTPETLQKKVLVVEHRILTETIRDICLGKL